MDKKNYYLALTYDLFVGEEQELMEQATIEKPLCFYSGLGMMLDKFEEATVGLEMNNTFDFVISKADAYGEYDNESVIDLPKNIFEVDGKIDNKVLFEGNVVPLQDQEGNRINASIVAVGEDTVTVDLNHPLAGEDLHFVGKVLVKREADEDEIRNLMSQHSCGSCHGDCEGEDCESGCCGCK
ncbi:MAG: FKBP-type peptidyl-prolyl cis-trans isomerase [Paludibacteraceae bacterium]|jgi:FKBP-type peptidyl-prolyl cis-trans isomerase SlyD|nr:FKBP-type peptidyl-prolyl cis-trans isomerase [Paludibacteraceae bacterium]OQA48172.1 MAG: FKBP-type peptidyl-prolyl cis-trans isomerase SlyD [Bacteroidetes bacterium ADurb.Bin302]HOH96075.1 FKBP-type peptidyl-prolyl cis-trans isomerase [Candidatus Enterocola sp.]HPG54918.1 FKBP-type peptidyl-prolyl cis-trans isomerase [Candidatus Enterocola sp.]